jgi:hypothetical protein
VKKTNTKTYSEALCHPSKASSEGAISNVGKTRPGVPDDAAPIVNKADYDEKDYQEDLIQTQF